jgi:acylphosphatase
MEIINTEATERFSIRGDVGSGVFPIWISRHASRLGLTGMILSQMTDCVEAIFSGPPELLDAMALGCSLGPQEVWVEEISRIRRNGTVEEEYSSNPAQIVLKL